MTGIASMLAQGGAQIGQQIGAPIAAFGQGLGGMLTARKEKQREDAAAQEAQNMLQRYANDPAQLNAMGQKYATEGNDALSKVFFDAAKIANRKQVAGLEAAGAEATRRAEGARKEAQKKAALQVANKRNDEDAVVGLESGAIDPVEYLKEKKEGSKAAVKTNTVDVVENGKVVKYIISTDPQTGEEVARVMAGSVPQEKEEEKDPFDSKWASDLLKEERTSANEAEQRASDYALLEKDVRDRPAYRRGLAGSAVGAAEEAIGIAGAAQAHRRRITKIRTMGVLDLLPPGVASDRDVKLAMDAEIDPNKLNNEEAERYYRGMRLIAEGEEEYHRQKVRWMTNSKDPNALGFDTWVQKEKANTAFEEAKTGPAFQGFLNAVTSANELKDSRARKEQLKALSELFPEEMEILVQLQQAEEDWENLEKKPKGFN